MRGWYNCDIFNYKYKYHWAITCIYHIYLSWQITLLLSFTFTCIPWATKCYVAIKVVPKSFRPSAPLMLHPSWSLLSAPLMLHPSWSLLRATLMLHPSKSLLSAQLSLHPSWSLLSAPLMLHPNFSLQSRRSEKFTFFHFFNNKFNNVIVDLSCLPYTLHIWQIFKFDASVW